MNYIEISFTLLENEPFTDIIIAKLNEIEFESYLETDKGVKAYIQESSFNSVKLDYVIQELQSFFSFDFQIKKIKEENWNEKWENSFSTVKINEDCIIRANFHDPCPDYKHEIIITPKMSFGTGHHETTFLMMDQMFKLDFYNKSVLDIGCGTGILSILSKMLGSNKTIGIDVDKWSYESSLENSILNNTTSIEFRLGDITSINQLFDIILANINRNVILSDLHQYTRSMKKNSNLLLSGFLLDDIKEIRDVAESLGLTFLSNKNKNEWNLLHFVK